jgi:WD40 repeat protein/tRNA A-37 threonylcarbamoyl transferase component Bud32
MSLDSRVLDLVVAWEEAQQGATPADLETWLRERCADSPEILSEVRRRIEDLQGFEKIANRPVPRPADGWAGPPTLTGYDILERIGRGGMGVVYKARERRLGRVVALKMILTADAEADQLDRFRAEAEAVARLQHPSIVQIFGVGEEEGRPFLALEFVSGGSLASKTAGKPLQPREAAALVRTLAGAMHYAHERGVVHRDLKPANILLAEDGTPKIADFGLAKRLDASADPTATGAAVGTPNYMAPEQAAGQSKEASPATDVWALGAILYELLTGRPPFNAATALETLRQVVSVEPVPPSRLQPQTPLDLETICLKCLRKEPKKRYASAAALADDLGRFLEGKPIHARPVPRRERVWKWSRRHPAAAALVVFAAGALAVVAWLAVSVAQSNSDLLDEVARKEKAEREARKNAEDARARQLDADTERKKAQQEADENNQRLIQMTVAKGRQLQEEGDFFAALPLYTDALDRAEKAKLPTRTHRLRLAILLRQCPRLVHAWSHNGPVSAVAFSPDGQWVLTAGADGTALVRDAATGQPATAKPLTHAGPINHAAFSPDSRRVVTGGDDRTARVWDAATGAPLGQPLKVWDAPVLYVAFHPTDNRLVLAAAGNRHARKPQQQNPVPGQPPLFVQEPRGSARVWDYEAGKNVFFASALGWMNHAAFSPDGRLVVTASGSADSAFENVARVWELASQKPREGYWRHEQPVNWACFSPDGTRVVTASGRPDSDAGEARVYEVGKEKPQVGPLKHSGQVTHAWFSPDGRRILTAGWDGTARVRDSRTGAPIGLALAHRDRLAGAWFSPDGRRVLTASRDGTARVWDPDTGEPLSPPLRHGAALTCAAFAPDGRRVLTADRDGAVRLWDLSTAAHGQPALWHRTFFHSDLSGGSIWFTQGQPFNPTHTTYTYLGGVAVTGVGFGPAERFVTLRGCRRVLTIGGGGGGSALSGGYETLGVAAWDAAGGEAAPWTLPEKLFMSALALSPDGRRLLLLKSLPFGKARPQLQLWDLVGRKLLARKEVEPLKSSHLAFTADNRPVLLAVAERMTGNGPAREVRLLDPFAGKALAPPLPLDAPLENLSLSPDAGRLALVTFRRGDLKQKVRRHEWQVQVWDVRAGKLAGPPLHHAGALTRVVLAPGGRHAVAYAADLSGFAAEVPELRAEAGEGSAYLWEVSTGKAVPLKHAGAVTFAGFSPDGRRVVTASADRTARLWDAATGAAVSPPLEHRAKVRYAEFAPDGLVVATTSDDRTARLWDAASGEPLGPPLRHKEAVLDASFSADGRRLVTAGADGLARVWDCTPEPRRAAELRDLARLLAGQGQDGPGGVRPLTPAEAGDLCLRLREGSPKGSPAARREWLGWHREELEHAREAGDWEAAVRHLEQLLALEPGRGRFRAWRGNAHGALGEWQKAEEDYAEAVRHGGDAWWWSALAAVQLRRGRADAYRRSCAAMLKRFGPTASPEVAGLLVRTCTLGPGAVKEPEALVALAKKKAAADDASSLGGPLGGLLEEMAKKGDRDKPRFPSPLLGRALCRAGRFAEALEQLKHASGRDRFFVALAHHALRQRDEARKALEAAVPAPGVGALYEDADRDRGDGPPWLTDVERSLLRQEAEALLGPVRR